MLDNLSKYLTLEKSHNNGKRKGFYHTNIISFQLIETTEKYTRRTTDEKRTYRIHLNLRVSKPVPTERTNITGIDQRYKGPGSNI